MVRIESLRPFGDVRIGSYADAIIDSYIEQEAQKTGKGCTCPVGKMTVTDGEYAANCDSYDPPKTCPLCAGYA